MKQALLCVSFGTSVPTARESITAVELALRTELPQADFFRAFTSPTIRKILAKHGEVVLNLDEALDQLRATGYTHITVQPTHLLTGVEYDKIAATVQARTPEFAAVSLGQPLLSQPDDWERLADILCAAYPAQPGRAVVFMGHGSTHSADEVYGAMQAIFHRLGRPDILLGTVEGNLSLADIQRGLTAGGYTSVQLIPLMLVAGDHALNDMAGERPESWKSVLEKEGYQVSCTLRGLGVMTEVQQMYQDHLRNCKG